MEGRCQCGEVRYRLTSEPMVVMCCHCTDCQRETGAAFAINALIEGDRVEVTAGAPELVMTPSASGNGQEIARCPTCRVAVWGHYGGAQRKAAFIRCGTLDERAAITPDVQIWTASKLPWVTLPDGVPSSPGFPDARTMWPEAARARWKAMVTA